MQTEADLEEGPEYDGPQHLAPRRRRRWVLPILIVLVLLIVMAIAGAVYLHGQISPAANGTEVQVTVPKGASTSQISNLLESKGVIANATVFRLYVKVKGTGEFQAGDYTLRHHQPYSQIIATMRKGPAVTVDRITIP